MDFEKLLNDILEAMKGEIKEDWSNPKGYLKKIIENNKESMIEITNYYLNNEFTLEEYQTELEAEIETVQIEMLALNVMSNPGYCECWDLCSDESNKNYVGGRIHKVTFYPLGNANTALIELENGKKILIDYANMKTDDEDDKFGTNCIESISQCVWPNSS